MREIADEIEEGRPGRSRSGCEDRPREHVQHRRAEEQADKDLAEDRWLAQPARQCSGSFRGADGQREEEKDLQRMSQDALRRRLCDKNEATLA